MRFYLAKDKGVVFCQPTPTPQVQSLWRFERVGRGRERRRRRVVLHFPILRDREDLTPKRCQLRENISSLIPIMSEQNGGNDFWNIKTVEKCGTLLMSELMRRASTSNRLEASILVSCSSKEGKFTFSVAVERCELFCDILHLCGEKAKLILEMYFKMPFTGEPTLAGLVTPEMSITSQKNDFSAKASDFSVTDAMETFWKKNTTAFGSSIRCFPRIFASCNLVLIVNDDFPLFQMVHSSDTNRRLLEETIHPDFEIITSDNAVVKCHKCFLTVHSTVLTRMLQSDMTESSSNRMKVKDMDKSVVVAFLYFLYCKDLPANDLIMSLQLLKAAHKYEIVQLEQATLKLLCQMEDVYFTAEFAWEVYVFVRNIPNGNDLKEKMMKIIYSERAWAVLDGQFCQLMRDTSDFSAVSEFSLWIFEKHGEVIEFKL